MRTHSLQPLKIFVRGEWLEVDVLLVPSCSLIQPGPNSRHLDHQIISAYFLCYGGYGGVLERPVQFV